jgi:iron complex outermembrane receptor protein
MQKKLYCFLAIVPLLFSSLSAKAQEKITITGKVFEEQNGNPLPGVNVVLKGSQKGTITDLQGIYKIKNVKKGNHTIIVSFIGYESQEKMITVKEGMQEVNFNLTPISTDIDYVEIRSNQIRKTEQVLKLDAQLKDIPYTTSTISRELIDQKQYTSINDALKYTTGINPTVNYGGFQTFNMRGFRGPVIMVDGARDERMNFSNSAPVTSLAAVERIEYLKGPASVLYGHSAVGGIINIIRKRPSPEFTFDMKASYGSWNTKEVSMGSGGNLTNKLNYRFDIGLSDRTGWRESNDKYANAYLAFDYKLNDKNKLEFRFGGNDDIYGTETGLPAVKNDIYNENNTLVYNQGDLPSNFNRETRYNDPSDFLKHKNQNAALRYRHDISDESYIQFHSSYAHDIIDYFSTEALSYLTDTNAIFNHYYMNGEDKIYICLDTLQRTYPFRFSHHTNTYQNYLDYFKEFSTRDINHKILTGYYFMYVDRTTYTGYNLGEDVSGDGLFAKISIVNPIVNQGGLHTKFSGARNYKEMINGFYIQDFLDISDKLKALLALRYDYYLMKYRTASVESGLNLIDYSETRTLSSSSLTYRGGLVYLPVPSLSIYASYSSFFKPNRKTYSSEYVYIDSKGKEFVPDEGKEFFKPLTGYQVEGGFKYTMNNQLQINSSVFYIVQNNIIEYLGRTTDDRRIYGQVGVIDSKGFEIEGVYSPFQGLKITTGYGLTEAKYQQFSNNEYAENSKEGNYVSQCPKNKFYSWVYYNVPKGLLRNVKLGAGLNYTDETFTETSNTYSLPAYWLLDASLGYSIKNIYLNFGVFNLLNTEYFSNYVYSTQYIPGYERNYKFTIGIKF